MAYTWLQIFRLVTFGFAIFSGLIEMALGADLTALSLKYFNATDNFESLGIAVGVLTMLTVFPMLIIDFLRTGAFTSMVLVELVWLSILWVLWLAEGALIADQTSSVFNTCQFEVALLNQACNETRAMEAFAFLTWLLLLAYTATLLVVASLNHSRGAPIWTSSLKQQPSALAPSTPSPAPAFALNSTNPTSQPLTGAPQQQWAGGAQQPEQQHSGPAFFAGASAIPTHSPAPTQSYSGYSGMGPGSAAGASSTAAHSVGGPGYPQV